MVDLVGLLGYYTLVAFTLNVFDKHILARRIAQGHVEVHPRSGVILVRLGHEAGGDAVICQCGNEGLGAGHGGGCVGPGRTSPKSVAGVP